MASRQQHAWASQQPISVPARKCEFEKQVESLGLEESDYASSAELTAWASQHYQTHFVPEFLLSKFKLVPEF